MRSKKQDYQEAKIKKNSQRYKERKTIFQKTF